MNDLAQPYSSFHTLSSNREVPRSLPFTEDGEKGLLCSILLSPKDILASCQASGLQSAAFYLPAHQIIYELVCELERDTKPIDFISLREALKDRDQLQEVGGVEYIDELYTFIPTAANASCYVESVRDKWIRRRGLVLVKQLEERLHDR